MTIRLREVVRSEMEGGLTGPANPIPSQSIDCGCGQIPCPKLAKFATRRLFVGLVCWIGIVQAAGHVYFYITGPTIARRFHIDPYFMDWILVVSEVTPFLLGLIVAYWGDRIHRASWTGALSLLQSVAYFTLVIPHLTHNVRVIEEIENVTHMSLYADESKELCSTSSSRVVIEEDEPCYVTISILIIVQVIVGMANVAYYSLGISYLDDNTKMKHVGVFVGVILAMKVMGVSLGYILAWGCLRIDAQDLSIVKSYREQIGAWWLGFPILAIFLIIPGLLISWFPRRLPSEVVEQAAETILDRANTFNRNIRRNSQVKVGSTNFWPSMGRLITNKILICNILSSVLCLTALINFMNNENIILESRFYVSKPTGMLLGFRDPLPSRITANILQPILIGFILIISGLVIARVKPNARNVVVYNIVMITFAATIMFSLVFAECKKRPIIGMNKNSITLLSYCNKNCRCSKDADFRPVCDSSGMFTFYSPCHAGCTFSEYKDNMKIYGKCNCVEYMTGFGNLEAKDGPCESSSCQIGWLVFTFGSMTAYALVASTFVGDLVINLRSIFKQDKALSIGFWMSCVAIFVYVVGKFVYELIGNMTCVHWGSEKWICHFHKSNDFGDYMCYLTATLLFAGLVCKILVWAFCKNLRLYNPIENDVYQGAREMQEMIRVQTENSSQQQQIESVHTNAGTGNEDSVNVDTAEPHTPLRTVEAQNEESKKEENSRQKANPALKYGPLGPGDLRSTSNKKSRMQRSRSRHLDSDDELEISSDDSRMGSSSVVAYAPLDVDSDVESELSGVNPRSRRQVRNRDYDQVLQYDEFPGRQSPYKRKFPNPDHYGDPRLSRKQDKDGSWDTNSFEYAKKGPEDPSKNKIDEEPPQKGDFNEVGIPVNPTYVGRCNSPKEIPEHVPVRSLINQYEKNTSFEALDDDRISVKSNEEGKHRNENINLPGGIPLIAMAVRPSSRGQTSSGFGSLVDEHEKNSEVMSDSHSTSSTGKRSKKAICTNL